MPNRNTFDDSQKYDHSSHSTHAQQPGDLHVPGHGGQGPRDGVKMNELPGKVSVRRKRRTSDAPR